MFLYKLYFLNNLKLFGDVIHKTSIGGFGHISFHKSSQGVFSSDE